MRRSTTAVRGPMANGGLVWHSVAVTVLVVLALTITSSEASKIQVKPVGETSLICKLLASAVSISRKAGQIIREIHENSETVRLKPNELDLQSKAKRAAHRCIVASFLHLYPKINVVAEKLHRIKNDLDVPEDWIVTEPDKEISGLQCPSIYDHVKPKNISIWIDGLDGTTEFAKGELEHVTTLIGISYGNESVAGVIYQPFWQHNGRAVWGLVGKGIGGVDVKKLPPPPEKMDDLNFVTTSYEYDRNIEKFFEELFIVHLERLGGAGYKVLHLLDGKAHVYVNPGTNSRRWDICASEAILKAAGGQLTNVHGISYTYGENSVKFPINRFGIFASAPGVNRERLAREFNLVILEIERRHMNS